ncbi:MAG: hypothetical protein R3244_12320 [Thermoanaerobaculia bacterium]|nr:hypothetical protein [Thermoanaerobaculia bacterium]
MRGCAATGKALVNLRLLDLVGRWDEFFAQSDIDSQLAVAFDDPPENVEELRAMAA